MRDDVAVPGGFTGRWFFWWADHPGAQVSLLVLVTALASLGYTNPAVVRDFFVSAAAADDPEPRRSRRSDAAGDQPGAANVEPFRVAGGDCVLVVDVLPAAEKGDQPAGVPRDFFSSAALTAMRDVAAELEAMPQVENVLWLDSVPGLNLFGFAGTLLPSSKASTRQFDNARRTVLDNPLAVGQLISPDGTTILMHLRLDWFYVTSDEAATTAIRERAERVAKRTPDAELRFRMTGPVPLHLMTADSHLHNAAKYQTIGYSIMLISALILFRGFSAVMIVAIAPAVGKAT